MRMLFNPLRIFFICINFVKLCNGNVDRLTLPSSEKGMYYTQRQTTVLLPNHCSTPVMTTGIKVTHAIIASCLG